MTLPRHEISFHFSEWQKVFHQDVPLKIVVIFVRCIKLKIQPSLLFNQK
jgi:hypothetical protein